MVNTQRGELHANTLATDRRSKPIIATQTHIETTAATQTPSRGGTNSNHPNHINEWTPAL